MAIESTINLDNELKQRLIDSLDKVEEWVRAGEGFAKEQAPLVVQDIVNWGVWGYGVMAIAAAVGIVACLVVAYISFKKSYDRYDVDGWFIVAMIASVATILLSTSLTFTIQVTLKASITPRVYVLEQLGVLK